MNEVKITPEGVIHRILYWISLTGMIIIKLGISTVLGMGSIDIIYKLNQPLGMGYATWASYAITALIFYLIPNMSYIKKRPLNLKVNVGSHFTGSTNTGGNNGNSN